MSRVPRLDEAVPVGIDDLVVDYGDTRIGPLSITLEPASFWCLFGPNGAGKSSLMRGLLGLTPAHGAVRLGEATVATGSQEVLRRVGWAPDETDGLPGDLAADETWEFHAWSHGGSAARVRERTQRAVALAEALGLAPAPRQLVRTFSLGMRKKTQLVAALLHEPMIVLLDEPRNGLDPLAAEALDEALEQVLKRGGCVVMATHDLNYAERRATHLALMREGTPEVTGSATDVLSRGRLLEQVRAAAGGR